MKRDSVNYVAVGAFVVLMGVGFMVLLYSVTGRSGPADYYHAYYENVAGLKFGTGVFYEGYHVGQIEEITPEPGDVGMRYRVDMTVSEGWRIPEDSVARVQSSGLISAVSIQISEGESKSYLSPGSELRAEGKTDIFSVLNQAASDFRVLSQEGLLPVLRNVNGRVTELTEEIIAFRREELVPFVRMMHKRIDEDLIERTVQLIDRLNNTAAGLNEILDRENRERIDSILVNVNDVSINLNDLVARIEVTRLQMNGLLDALNKMVSENRQGLEGATTSAERAMGELEASLRIVNENLSAIMHNIDGSARHMNEFARIIRENPSRLLRKTESAENPGP